MIAPSPNPSMRLYLWSAVSIGAASLVLLAIFSVYLFTRNLEIARQASRERMANLAAYIVDYMEKDFFAYTLVLNPENLPPSFVEEKGAWLRQIARATGLQRVALTDSTGKLYIASETKLRSGTSMTDPNADAADSACFEAAATTGKPVYCNRSHGAIRMQSLYHPFDFFGSRHVVILESDSNFLLYLEQYRTFILAVSIFLACVLAGLLAALAIIDRKAREAMQLSQRHEQLAFLGRTSAELAHELKNPLAIIKSSVDVLRRQLDPDRTNKAFHFLSDEVMRLSRIISNILGISRDRELDIRPFAPAAVLDSVQFAIREMYPDIEILVRLEEGLTLQGDVDAVRQVVENLTRNAAQAMDGKGRIHLNCRGEGKHSMLLIGDEGPGIPPTLRASLFDPFVTGNKSGTGLGLAIVRSLVERMGWRISLVHDSIAAHVMGVAAVKTCFMLDIPHKAPTI